MSRRVIKLWLMPVDAMLIVAHPSGVIYCNQVGGVNCMPGEIEGVLAPLELTDDAVERLMALPFAPGPGVQAEIADAIDAILGETPLARYLRVDRGRLRESAEAWV